MRQCLDLRVVIREFGIMVVVRQPDPVMTANLAERPQLAGLLQRLLLLKLALRRQAAAAHYDRLPAQRGDTGRDLTERIRLRLLHAVMPANEYDTSLLDLPACRGCSAEFTLHEADVALEPRIAECFHVFERAQQGGKVSGLERITIRLATGAGARRSRAPQRPAAPTNILGVKPHLTLRRSGGWPRAPGGSQPPRLLPAELLLFRQDPTASQFALVITVASGCH